MTTSPASEMKIIVNATPKLREMAHDPVCDGPVNLTNGMYWVVCNGVTVDAKFYDESGADVTQKASSLSDAGEYTIVATSSLGCVSDSLTLQLDIRKLKISMDPTSEICPGNNLKQEVAIDFSYNKDGAEAKTGNVKLHWTSEEKTSDRPTDNGEIDPDTKSFIYNTGNFVGKTGDTHTISISVTDGYCLSEATQIVTIENTAVDSITAEDDDDFVNVYTISGALVKANVKKSEALKGLSNGSYIVGNQKVVVR